MSNDSVFARIRAGTAGAMSLPDGTAHAHTGQRLAEVNLELGGLQTALARLATFGHHVQLSLPGDLEAALASAKAQAESTAAAAIASANSAARKELDRVQAEASQKLTDANARITKAEAALEAAKAPPPPAKPAA